MNGENLLNKIKNAKTKEEVNALLEEARAGTKLSLEDLDGVTGGVTDYFVCNGQQFTPEEVISFVDTVKNNVGSDQAVTLLNMIIGPYYSNVPESVINNAYRLYGSNMFNHLDNGYN